MARPTGLIAKEGLELLTFALTSGFKISIMLEELKQAYGKGYTLQPINIFEGVQKDKWFTELSPNGRIPVLVDHDNGGLAIMEGQAILQYLVKKYDRDHKFGFSDENEYYLCEQWTGFAQSHLGPYSAEAVFFNRFAPEHIPFAVQHFVGEVERLYGVLDTRLADREYLVGEQYSIADIANFAIVDVGPTAGVDPSQFPNLERWWSKIAGRPAVQKGSIVPFPLPLLGAAYRQRLEDEPEFKEKEEELFERVDAAKKQYGYKYSSP